MQGVTADDLRTTGDLRSKLQLGMTGIAGQFDALLMRTGGRKFRFDEEECAERMQARAERERDSAKPKEIGRSNQEMTPKL